MSDGAQSIALLIFSAIFFAFVLFFSLRPGKITVWIGKIINPIFLIFLAILVIAALIHPGASVASVAPTEAYATKTSAFFASFIEGYGTMDAIAGLAFGIVVIDVIRRMGVEAGRCRRGGCPRLRHPDRYPHGCHLRPHHHHGHAVARPV